MQGGMKKAMIICWG